MMTKKDDDDDGFDDDVDEEQLPLLPSNSSSSLNDNKTTKTNNNITNNNNVRLKGLLKMIFNNNNNEQPKQQKQQQQLHHVHDHHSCCTLFDYDVDALEETHIMYQTKRRRGNNNNNNNKRQQRRRQQFSSSQSIHEVINRHRYVAFFVIQYNPNGYYSTHTINLRKKLAMGYHDSMTIFCIFDGMETTTGGEGGVGDINNGNDTSIGSSDDIEMFLHGTGFVHLNNSSSATISQPLLLTLLNITQLPSIVVIDTTTGRSISSQNYTTLAIEWNDPHTVLNAWQRGNTTGLSCCQILLAILTCQK